MSIRNLTALLLCLSGVNLTLMIPGGFVETREFTLYPVSVIAGFNVFLTVLGLGSFVLAWRIWRGARRTLWAFFAGVSYVAVYMLDLAVIFPISQTPMSALLETLEWVGTGLGILLMIAGALFWLREEAPAGPVRRIDLRVLLMLAVITGAIVVFATVSAIPT